jgi:hypothetical protein
VDGLKIRQNRALSWLDGFSTPARQQVKPAVGAAPQKKVFEKACSSEISFLFHIAFSSLY